MSPQSRGVGAGLWWGQVHHANDGGGGRPSVAGGRGRLDPSNLPYLHRNPAV